MNLQLNPQYPDGDIMAREYLTRAYTILYEVEHGGSFVRPLVMEIILGFPYIETVYNMIPGVTPYNWENIDLIGEVLGVSYEMGAEHSATFQDRFFKWTMLETPEIDLSGLMWMDTAHFFGTKTGEAMIVEADTGNFLFVDIGEFIHEDGTAYRKYFYVNLALN